MTECLKFKFILRDRRRYFPIRESKVYNFENPELLKFFICLMLKADCNDQLVISNYSELQRVLLYEYDLPCYNTKKLCYIIRKLKAFGEISTENVTIVVPSGKLKKKLLISIPNRKTYIE